MFARCATWFESRGWPAPWRDTCSTSVPANVPRDTSASPQRVGTRSGSPPSKPGSAYVPEPVMTAINYLSLASRGTRPPLAPASVAGPLGAAMPSTRIAFRPRPSFSRPSVDETSRPVRSRTRSRR